MKIKRFSRGIVSLWTLIGAFVISLIPGAVAQLSLQPPTIVGQPSVISLPGSENRVLQLSGLTIAYIYGPNTVTMSVVSSSDTNVIPTSGVTFGGAGTATRSITIRTATNHFSTSNIDIGIRLTNPFESYIFSDYTVRVTLYPVNLPPVFAPGTNVTVNQNSGLYSAPWATGIAPSASPINSYEASQTVGFVVSNDNNALFVTQPAVSTNGTLTFQPAANAKGVANVSVYAKDSGPSGTNNYGGVSINTSPTVTFGITVNPVPIPPTISLPSGTGPALVSAENGSVSVPVVLGEVNDSLANVIITGTSDQPGVIDSTCVAQTSPGVTNPRTITITPKTNQTTAGTAKVTLTATNTSTHLSSTLALTVGVNYSNQPPVFTSGGNVTALQNSGLNSFPWATGIAPSAAPVNPSEASQSIQFAVSNNNPGLFTSLGQPAITTANSATQPGPGGVLSFTPVVYATGTATVTVFAKDSGGAVSPSQQFTITVLRAPIPPIIATSPTIEFNENGAAVLTVKLTDINDLISHVVITGTSTNLSLIDSTGISDISAIPSINPRSVQLRPKLNQFGSTVITLTASNTVTHLASSTTIAATVDWANQPPVFTGGGNVTVLQNSGPHNASPWATGIAPSAAPVNAKETSQTVTFTVTNNNGALFSVQPAITGKSPTPTFAPGLLTFTPASNASGTATVTVIAVDNGPSSATPGANNTSAPQTFVIQVNKVLIPPSLSQVPGSILNPVMSENGSIQYLVNLTDINDDSLNCVITGQSDNPGLIDSTGISTAPISGHISLVPIGLSSVAHITLTPGQNQNGTAHITLVASNTVTHASSAAFAFTLNVNFVNQPPVFTRGPNIIGRQNSGPVSLPWATGIYPCAYPSNTTEAAQTVGFSVSNDNNPLFTSTGQPAISPAGVLSFTPATNAKGSANVSVFAKDSGPGTLPSQNSSAAQTLSIVVLPAQIPPTISLAAGVPTAQYVPENSSASFKVNVVEINDSVANVQITGTSSNPNIIDSAGIVESAGIGTATPTITVTPKPNQSGTVTLILTVTNPATGLGSTFTNTTMTVQFANQPPVFTAGGNVIVPTNSAAYSSAWATGIAPSAAPVNAAEINQTVSFLVSNDANTLFASQPVVTTNGVLKFTPAHNATGVANVSVTARDSLGATSTPQSFTISIGVPNVSWTTLTRAPGGTSSGTGVAVDAAGNTYVAGSGTGLNARGFSVGFPILQKYDPSGTLVWSNSVSTLSFGSWNFIAIDRAGHIHVAGTAYSVHGPDSVDIVAAEYDTNGNLLWLTSPNLEGANPDNNYNNLYSFALDSAGNTFLSGFSLYPDGGFTLVFTVIKIEPTAGVMLWYDQYLPPGSPPNTFSYATSIGTDSAGNVIATGFTVAPNGSGQYTTIKYPPSSQNHIWVRNVPDGDSSGSINFPAGLKIDSSGNVVVAGANFSPTGGTIGIKYDPNGNPLWANSYGIGSARVMGMGPSGEVILADDQGMTAKLDSNGNLLWATTNALSSAKFTGLSNIAVDPSGNIFESGLLSKNGLAGAFSGMAITKYSPAGNLLNIQYLLDAAPNGTDTGNPVMLVLDSAGSVYATGSQTFADGTTQMATLKRIPSDFAPVP